MPQDIPATTIKPDTTILGRSSTMPNDREKIAGGNAEWLLGLST